MLTMTSSNDELVVPWVAERILGYSPEDFEPCSTLGISVNGVLTAGLIFNNYRKKSHDIHLTIAADSAGWISRSSLRTIFEYVFIQLGCIRLTVTIAKKNKRARRLAEGLGFEFEGKLRKGFDGVQDCIIYGMLQAGIVQIIQPARPKKPVAETTTPTRSGRSRKPATPEQSPAEKRGVVVRLIDRIRGL